MGKIPVRHLLQNISDEVVDRNHFVVPYAIP